MFLAGIFGGKAEFQGLEIGRILEFGGVDALYYKLNGIRWVRSNRGSLFLRHRNCDLLEWPRTLGQVPLVARSHAPR